MTQFNFNPTSQDLDLTNALFLVQISNLIYQPVNTDLLKTQFGLTQYKPFANEPTDTFGFLASNDSFIILAFRGTVESKLRDWFVDGKIDFVPSVEKGKVHKGFNEALSSIWQDLFDALNAWDNVDNLKLWVTVTPPQ